MLRARDNPFSTDRVLRERYRLDARGWAALFERLSAHARRGALVGPKGSGKTTLLEDLSLRLAERGWRPSLIRLSAEQPRMPLTRFLASVGQLGVADFVLLDGAEQLSRFAWLRFRCKARAAGGLVVTPHRAGRLPTLHRCTTSPALLQELAASLGHPLDSAEAADLYTRHAGNLREALRELYDLHARRGATALVSA